jgi:anti-sigma regulatory factor (Ser/Thr protein kinase)
MLPTSGYGLTVMDGLMDEVDIDVGPQGTMVSMTKHLR